MNKCINGAIIFSLLIVLLISCKQTSQGLPTMIKDKTWQSSEGFVGSTLVFYETQNGFLKAIKQVNGSGVPILKSVIYDVHMKEDTLLMLNGLDLKTGAVAQNSYCVFNEQTQHFYNESQQLDLLNDSIAIYSWEIEGKQITARISAQGLKNLALNKKQIYKKSDIIAITFD